MKVAESIVDARGLYLAITADIPIVETLTDGLLVLAWESLESAAQNDGRQFTGVQMKQMLAILVAAVWRGAAAVEILYGDIDTEKIGKRLHKQVQKVQKLLADISSKATRARSALSKDAGASNELAANLAKSEEHTRRTSSLIMME
eukprot:7387717-Prymnesium_polylepis.1